MLLDIVRTGGPIRYYATGNLTPRGARRNAKPVRGIQLNCEEVRTNASYNNQNIGELRPPRNLNFSLQTNYVFKGFFSGIVWIILIFLLSEKSLACKAKLNIIFASSPRPSEIFFHRDQSTKRIFLKNFIRPCLVRHISGCFLLPEIYLSGWFLLPENCHQH